MSSTRCSSQVCRQILRSTFEASSRVGRTHVGFCLLIPTPQRRRDRYIVEVYDMFHRFLERMVQPASIDRWAQKAVERVFPSVFQAYFCGVLSSSALLIALSTGIASTEYTVVGRLKQLFLVNQMGQGFSRLCSESHRVDGAL